MRELFTILELVHSSTPMENCEEFNGVKSILEYCNNHVRPFDKMFFHGGNEIFIDKLVGKLQEYLIERSILHQDEERVLIKSPKNARKILMFLVLNTDVVYTYNLDVDINIVHVLKICPLMPISLLVTLIWRLHLDKHFYELLSYSPCWFSFQYFPSATDSLKYIEDPYEVLEKVHGLLKAIFISITRSTKVEMHNVDMKIIYNKLSDYAMNLLRIFYTPDAEKLQAFTKKQYYKYIGFVILHLLQLVLYTFNVFEQPSLAELKKTEKDLEIFDICPNLSKKTECTSEELKFVYDHNLKIIYVLLNALQNNVMMINVDIFIYWVEVDLKENNNLQMAIGNLAYTVSERITSNKAFDHAVGPQLKNISIRPRTLQEILKDATIGDILLELDKKNMAYHIKKAWFDELLSRDIALGNEECLETIKQNIKLMNADNCQKILDFIKIELQRAEINSENEEEVLYVERYDDLKKTVLHAIQNFNICQILELLTYQSKLFGFNNLVFLQDDTVQRITEFLNKYSTETNAFNFQEFLLITFEYPQVVWQKFFDCAIHNKIHIGNYCMSIKLALPISNNYYLTHLENVLQDSNQIQQQYLPNLLCELYFQLYYPNKKSDFLKQIIHKYVNYYLESKQFECVLPLMKCLNLIESYTETQSCVQQNFGEITSPVLLMAAQIMDKARWDLITYSDIRDELVRECVQFIERTSEQFLPHATEKDRKWITKTVKDSYKPITQYYFQKYSLTKGELPKDFDRFLTCDEINDQTEVEILLINFVRCTMTESEWLTCSERFLPHISNAMLILSNIVNETENVNSINNYRHCLANYANIVQKILIPKIENDKGKVEECLMKILKIISATPVSIYDDVFLNFESLIVNIIKINSLLIDKSVATDIQNFIENMKHCSSKLILLEKLKLLSDELKS